MNLRRLLPLAAAGLLAAAAGAGLLARRPPSSPPAAAAGIARLAAELEQLRQEQRAARGELVQRLAELRRRLEGREAGGEPGSSPILGVAARDTGEGGRGVLVLQVPASSAAAAGLRPGDLIVGLEGEAVGSLADLGRLLAARRAGETARVAVSREGRLLELAVPLLPAP